MAESDIAAHSFVHLSCATWALGVADEVDCFRIADHSRSDQLILGF
jgi:hypothetical protein